MGGVTRGAEVFSNSRQEETLKNNVDIRVFSILHLRYRTTDPII